MLLEKLLFKIDYNIKNKKIFIIRLYYSAERGVEKNNYF